MAEKGSSSPELLDLTEEEAFGAAPAGTSLATSVAPEPAPPHLAGQPAFLDPKGWRPSSFLDYVDPRDLLWNRRRDGSFGPAYEALAAGFTGKASATDYPELEESLLLDRPYTEERALKRPVWVPGEGDEKGRWIEEEAGTATTLGGEGIYKGVMYVISGEVIRGPPSRMTGLHRAQRLRESNRGELPGDPMGETWTSGGWQTFLNTVAGAAGIVGSKVAFPLMGLVAGVREATEVLAHEVAKRQDAAQGSGESAQAIQKALSTGDLAYASHQLRFARRLGAGARMTLESLSLPVAAAVNAPEGEKLDAAVDAFFMYPVESLVGPFAVGKFATRFPKGSRVPVPAKVKVGGKTIMEVIKEPSKEAFTELVAPERKVLDIAGETIVHELPPRQSFFGRKKLRPLEMAPWAHEIFYKTPDWLKPVIWDTFTPTDQVAMSRLRTFQKLSSTQNVRAGVDALFDDAKYTQFKLKLKEKAEDSGMGVLSEKQLDVLAFDSIQGILYKDLKSGKATFAWDAATEKANKNITQWDREVRSIVPGNLRDYMELNSMGLLLDGFGLDGGQTELVMSYVMRMAPDLVAGDAPSTISGVPSALLHSVDGSPTLVSELTEVGAAITERAALREVAAVEAPALAGKRKKALAERRNAVYDAEALVERAEAAETAAQAEVGVAESAYQQAATGEVARPAPKPVVGSPRTAKATAAIEGLFDDIGDVDPQKGSFSSARAAIEGLFDDIGDEVPKKVAGQDSPRTAKATAAIEGLFDDIGKAARTAATSKATRAAKAAAEARVALASASERLGAAEAAMRAAEVRVAPEAVAGVVAEVVPEGTVATKRPGGKKARKEYIAATEKMRGKASPEQERHFVAMDKMLKKYGDGGQMFASPADLYKHFNDSLRNMTKSLGSKELTGSALKALAVKMGNDPAWIEYINTPKSANGLTWKPHETVLPGRTTADGLSMAEAVKRAAPGLRMYVALGEIEPRGRFGPRGLPVTKKGRLVSDVPKNKYDQTIDRIFRDFAGPEADRRAALVTAIYNERPILRLKAQPDSPPLVTFLADQMVDPESFLYELGELFSAQQQELPRLLGVEPLKIMKTANTYVTRSWNDMAERRMDIQWNLNNDIFGIPLRKTAPRHRRRLSDIETQRRYIEMMGEDPTGFTAEQVVKWSVDQTEMMIQSLHFFDDTLTWLEEQGIDTSKRRAGYDQVPTLADVDPAKAHSPDPYNWMFGKMAGKWVPADMARSLKMSRKVLERVPPIMSVWKLMHTAFNLPGYQVRNELGDLLNIAVSSGFDPTSKVWRATRRKVYKEMEQYYGKNAASKDIQEAVGRGVMVSKDVDSPSIVTGDAPIETQASAIGTEALDRILGPTGLDPTPEAIGKTVSTLNNLLTLGEFAKGSWQKWGVTSVRGEKGIKLGTAWNNVGEVFRQSRSKGRNWRTSTSNALLQTNSELASGVISKWTVRQENRRRLFAYKIGRELGLDEATAARWALDAIHDYGDRPGWLRYTQTAHVLPYVTPPFSTYLYKQTMFGMRQALTKPELFVSWMMLQGMNAYDEQYRIDRDKMIPGPAGNRMPDGTKTQSEQEYLLRYRSSMLSSYGANKMYLQSGNDVAEAIQDTVGFFGGRKGRELAKNSGYLKAIRGWDKNGNLHKLTYVLPLRDIGNLSSMLADFQPNEASMRQAARMNPFTDLFIMATMHGLAGTRTLKSEATGEQVNPDEPGTFKYVSRILQQMAHTFTPWLSWDRYGPASILTGTTRDALVSASRGEVYTVGKKGYPIDPISAVSRTMTPGLSVSALDQVNMQTRVMNKYEKRTRDMNSLSWEYKFTQLTGFGEEEMAIERRSKAIVKIRTQDTMLQMEYALGRTTRREAQSKRNKLRERWKQLDAKFKKGENVFASEVGTIDSKITTRALLDAVNSVYTGGKNDPITEEEFFGVGEIE